MRILIVGDRHWTCPELAKQIVGRLLARYGPDLVVIHGGEPGVDQAVAAACRDLGVPHETRLVQWHQTGLPTVGSKNRELIMAAPDLCVAIHQSIGVEPANTGLRTPGNSSRHPDVPDRG